MLHNLVVGTFPKEHARTVIEKHFFQLLLAKHKMGDGKMIGEDGGIQLGALLSLQLYTVTTNCHY